MQVESKPPASSKIGLAASASKNLMLANVQGKPLKHGTCEGETRVGDQEVPDEANGGHRSGERAPSGAPGAPGRRIARACRTASQPPREMSSQASKVMSTMAQNPRAIAWKQSRPGKVTSLPMVHSTLSLVVYNQAQKLQVDMCSASVGLRRHTNGVTQERMLAPAGR